MTDSEGEILRLVRILATYPVLPPAEALPPNDDAFRSLLAELARSGASRHAATLRAVSADRRVPADELARRAQFLLTCLLMPASGTHYEVLGLAPDATKDQIRKRWAALMQRYHPDHQSGAAPGSNWLDGQARRLIEAYNTLKDPARRRAYDARFAGDTGERPRLMAERWRDRTIHFVRPNRWKWAPAGIAAVGIVAALWALAHSAREPLPRVPLPAAPNLLGRWGMPSEETGTTTALSLRPGRSSKLASIVPPAVLHAGSPPPAAWPPEPAPSAAQLAAVAPAGPVESTPSPRPVPPAVAVHSPSPAPRTPPAGPTAASAPAPSAATVVAPPAAPLTADAPARAETLALIEAFRAACERKDLTAVMAL